MTGAPRFRVSRYSQPAYWIPVCTGMTKGPPAFSGETVMFPYLLSSAFDVGTLLGNLAVPHSKHVYAPQASGIPITIHLAIYPAPDATVAKSEYIFGFEICLG